MQLFREDTEFTPITIVLENEHEARALLTILDHSANLWNDVSISEYEQDSASVEEVSLLLFDELCLFDLESYAYEETDTDE